MHAVHLVKAAAFATLLLSGIPAYSESSSVTASADCSYGKSGAFCGFTMKISGKIDASTVEKVQKGLTEIGEPLRALPHAGAKDWRFEIDSPGGSIDAAMEIGRIFRKLNAFVVVDRNSSCVSACPLAIAGATTRIIDGRVGIHRPFFATAPKDTTSDTVQRSYDKLLQNMRSYLQEMNVSERLVDDMIRIGPERVRFLTHSDLDGYGLGERDIVYDETLELAQAQKYGLDRLEYMRRKAQADRQCNDLACRNRILRSGQ